MGTACGLFASVIYTAANVCLRAVADCDAVWVSAVKATPTVVLVAPWLVVIWWRGERVLPAPRALAILVLGGLLGQLGGNVLFQWSLGVVGMALAVPLTLGTLILAGALLGRVFLNEPISLRTLASIVLLTAAICLLSLGAGEAHRSVETPAATRDAAAEYWPVAAVGSETQPTATRDVATEYWLVAAGVLAALASGLAYAVLGVVIRYGVTGRASLSVTLVTIASTGVVSLGLVSWWRVGWQGMSDTAPDDLATMLLAGTCNAIAFVALTRSLQLTSVVYANALTATQAGMAAIAGVLFFHEAWSGELVVGVSLTILGVWVMRERQRRDTASEIRAANSE